MSNVVYRVYVIELAPEACRRTDCASWESGLPHVYVGETNKSPRQRFAEHRAGGFLSRRRVRTWGIRLLPELYKPIRPLRTREASRKAEAALATALSERGHCVFGGH